MSDDHQIPAVDLRCIRAATERAKEARKEADRLACEAWNKRMLGFRGPAQPSPTLGDALNAGYLYLEVRCLGCDTHQTVPLDVVRRPKTTPIHELERSMSGRDGPEVRAMRTRGATWLPCSTARFQRVIHRQCGGPERDESIKSYVRRRPEVTGNRPNRHE